LDPGDPVYAHSLVSIGVGEETFGDLVQALLISSEARSRDNVGRASRWRPSWGVNTLAVTHEGRTEKTVA
jgi:hypothetical protein